MAFADDAWIEQARRAGRDASAWRAHDLERDPGWITRFDGADRTALIAVLRAGLWLATPDGARLPRGWASKRGAEEPGVVKGGVRGPRHDRGCREFERRQADDLGMRVAT
jgi:hypothetical protein